MGTLRCIFNISIIAVLSCGLFSCSESDDFNLEREDCSVTINGFSFSSEAMGGAAIDINKQTGNVDESLNTPESVSGYKVSVQHSDPAVPVIEQEFRFVDGGGLDYGIIEKVKQGSNTFTAESIRNSALFEDKPEVGGFFKDGWYLVGRRENLTVPASGWSWNIYTRTAQYQEAIEDRYPCYSIYRETTDMNIIAGVVNEVAPFDMEVVNGRLVLVIENKKSDEIRVYMDGEEVTIINSGEVKYILKNDTTEDKLTLNLEIKKWKKQGRNWVLRKINIDRSFLKFEPGKNKTRLIEVV